MRALTIRQPWAWAITHADKRVENRNWKPPENLIGERIAIHAGKVVEGDAVRLLGRRGLAVPDDMVSGAVVGVAVIDSVVTERPGDIWFTGPYGWVLTGVIALERPVACRGAQRLWEVPGEVQRGIDSQLRGAGRIR